MCGGERGGQGGEEGDDGESGEEEGTSDCVGKREEEFKWERRAGGEEGRERSTGLECVWEYQY